MSLITVVALACILWILFRPSGAIYFLAVSAVFQPMIVFESGSVRVWLYHAIALPVCFHAWFGLFRGSRDVKLVFDKMLWFFGVAALLILGAFLLPRLFSGVPVFEARGGMDYMDVSQLFPLDFTVSNIAQSGYLVINLSVILFLASMGGSTKAMRSALEIMFVVGFAVFIWQVLSVKFGVFFPEDLLRGGSYERAYRTEYFVDGSRVNGSFGEPADLGLFAAVCFGYGLGCLLLMGRIVVGAFLILAGFLMAIFSGSSTAAVAMLGPILGLAMCFKRLRLNMPIALVGVFSLIAILAWGSTSPAAGNFLDTTVRYKAESESFENRLFSVSYSWDLFLQTHGMGVGLGSHRPSSMIAMLVGCLGLLSIPVVFYLYFYTRKLVDMTDAFFPTLYCAFTAALLAAAVSIPDLSHVTFGFLASCVAAVLIRYAVARKSGFERGRM